MVTFLTDMRLKLDEQVETIWFVNGREVVYYLYNFGWKCLRNKEIILLMHIKKISNENDYELKKHFLTFSIRVTTPDFMLQLPWYKWHRPQKTFLVVGKIYTLSVQISQNKVKFQLIPYH